MCHCLIYYCHIPVALELFQMPSHKIVKLFPGIVRLVNLLPEQSKHLFCLVAEKLDKDIIFIFEIEIYRTVGNTGLLCNL